jgi:hypothetical protein
VDILDSPKGVFIVAGGKQEHANIYGAGGNLFSIQVV